ncbi:MAG: aspartate carbamoyltransferase [Clostridiales bacterium]|jgi:aspartate carbamoyltransferase catalytic subunit|nr:aspartate carbamoyltransferase [Clostridiales bacterium]
MRHVLSCEQFSREEIDGLFNLTDHIRQNEKAYSGAISDKVVATIFYEPSTRTRLSFEAAILRLGGKNISTENANEMSSAIKGESLTDTIRVMDGYADAIIMRHPDIDSAVRAAEVSRVPIINAGAGSGEHPTQALLDAYTIYKNKGKIDGISVAVMGDLLYGRTIHSLIKLLCLYKNITIFGLSNPALALSNDYLQYMAEKGVNYTIVNNLKDLPSDLDIIYQTRTQTERFLEKGLKAEEIVIDKAAMQHFGEDTLILHPLPRRHEIAPEVDSDPRAKYFEQSTNGMYMRMGLLYEILVNSKN